MSSANCGGGGGSGVGALVPTHRRGGFGRRCQDTANSLPGGQPAHGGPAAVDRTGEGARGGVPGAAAGRVQLFELFGRAAGVLRPRTQQQPAAGGTKSAGVLTGGAKLGGTAG